MPSRTYLFDIRPEDARQALRIAARLRRTVQMMAGAVDAKPGRNLRWEIGRDLDRIASLIGDGFPAGRVLLALSEEFAQEWGEDFTAAASSPQKGRQRAGWLARLKEMDVEHPEHGTPQVSNAVSEKDGS